MISKIVRLSTAYVAATGGALLVAVGLFAVPSPGPQILEDSHHVELPVSLETDPLRWIEVSSDLINWEPLARDYGFTWENVYPSALEILEIEGVQVMENPESGVLQYYRILEAQSPELSNRESVSRFLQQATFGPSLDMIESFPGIESEDFDAFPYPHHEAWIETEIAKPVFSLRRFFRERSNPEFVDNSDFSPFEVGYNPEYGHQLVYNVGQTKFYPNEEDAIAADRPETDVLFSSSETKQIVWYQSVIIADDVLRQRVAWALAQLFVVGESGSNQSQATDKYLSYYDIFVRHAFGNFRDILDEVTYHPVMGYYLTYVNNKKADPDNGTFPDENYARELMQLFTIGLWELNQDGTFKLDEDGALVPTYDNDDVSELAKVFTGLRRVSTRENIEIVSGNYVDPMYPLASWHDFSEKTLLDGSTHGPFPETAEGVEADIDGTLDHLFEHSNTPTFVARHLIQRLTMSNPSPRYIYDVSQAFIDGQYHGNGSGVRGDLGAVIRAVLLHPEAREPSLTMDRAHGKLREPLIRLMHFARSFNITSNQTHGLFPFYQLELVIEQSPFNFPSVFNFYLPDYQPVGSILDGELYAPEFQIHTDVTSLGLANAIRKLIYEGIVDEIGRRSYTQGELDLSHEVSLANDTDSLIEHLNLLLTAGRLTEENRKVIANTVDEMPVTTDSEKLAKARRAMSLFSLLPEFNVLY